LSASGETPSTRFFSSLAKRRRKKFASAPTSALLYRSGGISIDTTFKR
jgi:hypothetical protein